MRKNKSGWFVTLSGITLLCLSLSTPSQAKPDKAANSPIAPKVAADKVATTTPPPPKPVVTPALIKPTKIAMAPAFSQHTIYQYMPDASSSLSTESKLSEISKEIAGKILYELKEAGTKQLTSRVAVVAAVPLSDLKRETEFGRLIAEYHLTDLADRGLRVKELRLGKDINILPQTGEFILSRNIGEIANDSPALDYVVVSTFTNTRKTLILQGRLVSLKTGLIKTAWRYNLPMNRELLSLLYARDREPFVIAVKGIGQQ